MGEYMVPKNVLPPEEQVPPSEYQQKFVEGIQMGMVPNQAAHYAGVDSENISKFVKRAMQNAWVVAQVEKVRDDMAEKADYSRDRVLGIVDEAIDMARMQASPADMLKGVNELNKMLGYYAPEKKEITTNSAANRVQTEFEAMSQEELLELVGKQLDPIEVEFEVLDGE